MLGAPPRSKRTDTPFPDTTLFRSVAIDSSVTALMATTAGGMSSQSHRLPSSWPGRPATNKRTSAIPKSAVENSSRSEEHTSELQSLMRISYAVFCLKKKKPRVIYDTKNTKRRLYTQKRYTKI